MELFAIVLSCPAAFVASFLYATLLRRAATSWPRIRVWFRGGSAVVLSALASEVLLLGTLGPVSSRRLLDGGFFVLHLIVFLLGSPSLASLLVLQSRLPLLAKPCVAAMPSAVLAVCLTLMHYGVWEAF